MFDLPDLHHEQAQFWSGLLKQRFMMLQCSDYGRYVVSEDEQRNLTAESSWRSAQPCLSVRITSLTNHQIQKMEVWAGENDSLWWTSHSARSLLKSLTG